MFNLEPHKAPSRQPIKANNFYRVARIMRDFDNDNKKIRLAAFVEEVSKIGESMSEEHAKLLNINSAITQEIRNSSRGDSFKSISQQEQDLADFVPDLTGTSFLRTVHTVFRQLDGAWNAFVRLAEECPPEELFIGDYDKNPLVDNLQDRQLQMMELEWNLPVVNRFVENTITIIDIQEHLFEDIEVIVNQIERFYEFLQNRHSVEGVKIFRDPIITDLAISIFNNIDAHGEIASGKDPKSISAYTEAKGLLLCSAVKTGRLPQLLNDPEGFQKFVQNNIGGLRSSAINLQSILSDITGSISSAIAYRPNRRRISDADWAALIQRVQDANVASIKDKSEEKLLSPSERHAAKFKNETIEKIVELLTDSESSVRDVLDYILQRKAEMRRYQQEENSFFTCRISAGNPFLGQAPGALEVISSEKPNAKLDDILGSGYDEVRDFVKGIDGSMKWNDLFLATSPRKKVDRMHLLMIGPPGCGKTEIMRSVANHERSVGIFAQGSDFLTCWKGEDQKNPKRLFEQAVKIQKDTKKHVHIMIDEIDSVLNNDRGPNDTNLNLEFQILMDGMISYPHISVWGATNLPERIPMPMIRRFKVLIVGELSNEDRVKLLKHYLGFLPHDINDDVLGEAAQKLDGATGDVIAKVAESLWKTKMIQFVADNKDAATKLSDELNKEDQFDIRSFDEKSRFNFKQKLKSYVSVSEKDLFDTIDSALKTVGINSEIKSAQETYDKARRFIAQINNVSSGQSSLILR